MKLKRPILIIGTIIILLLLPKIQSLLNPIKISITEIRYERNEIFIDISITNTKSTAFIILNSKDIIFLKQFSFVYSPSIWEKQNLKYIIWQTRPYPIGERIPDEIRSGETKFFTLRLNDFYPETPFEKPGGNLYCYLSLWRCKIKSPYDGASSNKVSLRENIE